MGQEEGEHEGSNRGSEKTATAHHLSLAPDLGRRAIIGAVVAVSFGATALIVDGGDLLSQDWQIGLWLGAFAWLPPFAADFVSSLVSDIRKRRDIAQVLDEVAREMVEAFARGYPEAGLWIERDGLDGAMARILRDGHALHVPSAVHVGGPTNVLARWHGVESTLSQLRPNLDPYLTDLQRRRLGTILFLLRWYLERIEIAKTRVEGDLKDFQAVAQDELEATSSLFHRVVEHWLQMWESPVPDAGERKPMGKEALQKITKVVTRVPGTYYYLRRADGYAREVPE